MVFEKYALVKSKYNIAPAIRGCVSSVKFPVVTFVDSNCEDISSLEEKTGLKVFAADECETAEEYYKLLSEKRNFIDNVDAVLVNGIGIFVIASSKYEADRKRDCIINKEKYENRISRPFVTKRLEGRIVVITGGAQGFGKNIAEILADNGAQIVIADINIKEAKKVAEEINERTGLKNSIAISCDVADEQSIESMCKEVVNEYGGIDVMFSNAGICEAGSIEALSVEVFERVTRINYIAFFIVCKYASRPMKIQHIINEKYFSDIIQTNSKVGFKGGLNNSAYCGSKFGGIGLVQSISRELVKYRIKVNCVCPGNYYDGPLWGDPVKGLFVKYFEAGKVEGAKNPEEVRDWYFSQELFNRGCMPLDVARAVMYIIEQEYETGQAVPVAGGAEMIN